MEVKVGVSNRHVHLTKEDVDILFGKDYELTPRNYLDQPGQYATEETVTPFIILFELFLTFKVTVVTATSFPSIIIFVFPITDSTTK